MVAKGHTIHSQGPVKQDRDSGAGRLWRESKEEKWSIKEQEGNYRSEGEAFPVPADTGDVTEGRELPGFTASPM
jgi:hypothetical protein